MPNGRSWRFHALLTLLVLTAANALAMSGTSQVAWPGKPVAARADWPEGVLDLVNDPLRTEGWNPWFSECPNDVDFYSYAVEGTTNVNHLIAKLAAIKGAKARVLLYPDKEPRVLALTTVLGEDNGAAVVFSIGGQQRMNEWYQHLHEEKPGVRVFGVHRYQEPPEAQPPTLALHVGNGAIDLKGLKIPASVKVQAVVSDAERAEPKTAGLVKAINDFVAKHAAKPAPQQPEPTSK
jgi:hypothetical protein